MSDRETSGPAGTSLQSVDGPLPSGTNVTAFVVVAQDGEEQSGTLGGTTEQSYEEGQRVYYYVNLGRGFQFSVEREESALGDDPRDTADPASRSTSTPGT